MNPYEAFYQGACMVLLDGLAIGGNVAAAQALRKESVNKIQQLLQRDFRSSAPSQIHVSDTLFGVEPFFIPKGPLQTQNVPYALSAPTTSNNVLRVLRGLQLSKPILLEGSPGVGYKETIISPFCCFSIFPFFSLFMCAGKRR
jgi:midasin (ATPase involved in ribosome maturation)